MLDTGAYRTCINPMIAKILGISPSEESPRQTVTVFGGQQFEAPVVNLSSIQVGDALVENLEVGVYNFNPKVALVDGILGSDFLKNFKVTVDRASSRLQLAPLTSDEQAALKEKPVSNH